MRSGRFQKAPVLFGKWRQNHTTKAAHLMIMKGLGCSYEDICEELGITIGQAYKLYAWARKRIEKNQEILRKKVGK